MKYSPEYSRCSQWALLPFCHIAQKTVPGPKAASRKTVTDSKKLTAVAEDIFS
jgi:hypothetical protein